MCVKINTVDFIMMRNDVSLKEGKMFVYLCFFNVFTKLVEITSRLFFLVIKLKFIKLLNSNCNFSRDDISTTTL
jgi:hypothetical protein